MLSTPGFHPYGLTGCACVGLGVTGLAQQCNCRSHEHHSAHDADDDYTCWSRLIIVSSKERRRTGHAEDANVSHRLTGCGRDREGDRPAILQVLATSRANVWRRPKSERRVKFVWNVAHKPTIHYQFSDATCCKCLISGFTFSFQQENICMEGKSRHCPAQT